MTDMTIAKTILEQLGGNRFARFTGARNFVGSERGLSFKVPGTMTHCGINYVKIELTPMDTYAVSFCKARKLDVRTIREFADVHCDQLEGLFVRITGLVTRF